MKYRKIQGLMVCCLLAGVTGTAVPSAAGETPAAGTVGMQTESPENCESESEDGLMEGVVSESVEELQAEESDDAGVSYVVEDGSVPEASVTGEPGEAPEVISEDSEGAGIQEQTAETEEPEAPATSGTCGVYLSWSLSPEGVLSVTGTGAMSDYSLEEPAPWSEYSGQITAISVEEGVTQVGAYAFNGLMEAARISLPASLQDIGQGALRDCGSLQKVEVPEDSPYLNVLDGVLYTADLSQLIFYPQSLTADCFETPRQVCVIRAYAFYGQKHLCTLKITGDLSNIGENAFAECTSLTDITA